MAMTSRAVRADVFGPGATGPAVGPGSYRERDLELQRVRHSHAPFSSSVERATAPGRLDDGHQTPGPGCYALAPDAAGAKPGAALRSSQFASRAPRLLSDTELPKKALTPGPGTYRDAAAEPWVPKLTQTQPPAGPPGRTQSINWIKVATAPSIPASNQSHGYEEGTRGELIQQRPPEQGHAGKGRDTAGPGEYDPIEKWTRPRNNGPDFGKSKGTRDIGIPKDLQNRPGPGSYDSAGAAPKRSETADGPKATSVFASSTVRNFVDKKAAEFPGPGTYNSKSTFATRADHLTQTMEGTSAFGSTLSSAVDRFGNPQGPAAHTQPGPGHYSQKSCFDKERSRWEVSHGGFTSSTVRFEGNKTTEKQTPGPGFYTDGTERHSLSAKITRRMAGRYGVFGSTSQRFPGKATQATSATSGPAIGPGSYDPQTQINPAEIRRRDARTAAFVSNTDRSAGGIMKVQETTPGVGEYDLGTGMGDTHRRHGGKQPRQMGSEPRFKPRPDDITPGPGDYEVAQKDMTVKVLGGMPVTSRRGVVGRPTHKGLDRSGMQRPIGDRALRFPPTKSDTPGPGQYNMGAGMIRKTFNITVGDTWD